MGLFTKKDDTKKPEPEKKEVKTRKFMGGANPRNREAFEAAGMKRGGAVKKPGSKRYC